MLDAAHAMVIMALDLFSFGSLPMLLCTLAIVIGHRGDGLMNNVGRRSRVPASIASALALILIFNDQAAAAIRVKIEYDFNETEISPQQTTHRSHGINIYILQGSKISTIDSNSIRTEASLGSRYKGISPEGTNFRRTTEISRYSFTIKTEHKTDYRITKITTDGVSSCQASREAILKPGQRYFLGNRKTNHEVMYDSEQRWDNMTCVIQNE